jgi:hypothetical protein
MHARVNLTLPERTLLEELHSRPRKNNGQCRDHGHARRGRIFRALTGHWLTIAERA